MHVFLFSKICSSSYSRLQMLTNMCVLIGDWDREKLLLSKVLPVYSKWRGLTINLAPNFLVGGRALHSTYFYCNNRNGLQAELLTFFKSKGHWVY